MWNRYTDELSTRDSGTPNAMNSMSEREDEVLPMHPEPLAAEFGLNG